MSMLVEAAGAELACSAYRFNGAAKSDFASLPRALKSQSRGSAGALLSDDAQ